MSVKILKLVSFSQNAKKQDFINIWGERLGVHFWGKFTQSDNDLLATLARMDTQNIEKLTDYLSDK